MCQYKYALLSVHVVYVFVHIVNPHKSRHVDLKHTCLVKAGWRVYTCKHTHLRCKSATQALPLETHTHINTVADVLNKHV